MTEYIGDVPVSSIQNVSVSKKEGEDEIDLIDEESNIIIGGIDEGQDIEIEFSIIEDLHPDNDSLAEQKEELQKLLEREYPENTFQYYSFDGFVTINDLSFLESSESANILDGKMSGLFLPYPKYEGIRQDTTEFDFSFNAGFL